MTPDRPKLFSSFYLPITYFHPTWVQIASSLVKVEPLLSIHYPRTPPASLHLFGVVPNPIQGTWNSLPVGSISNKPTHSPPLRTYLLHLFSLPPLLSRPVGAPGSDQPPWNLTTTDNIIVTIVNISNTTTTTTTTDVVTTV